MPCVCAILDDTRRHPRIKQSRRTKTQSRCVLQWVVAAEVGVVAVCAHKLPRIDFARTRELNQLDVKNPMLFCERRFCGKKKKNSSLTPNRPLPSLSFLALF